MKPCLSDDPRLSAWIDGELSEDEAGVVAEHVERCPACAELVASFRSWSFSETRAVEPDPGFLVRFRERRDALAVGPWWTWRRLALGLLPVAAVLLLAALVSIRAPAHRQTLEALENEAIGAPIAFDAGPEAVLSIAFEPFPAEEP